MNYDLIIFLLVSGFLVIPSCLYILFAKPGWSDVEK